MKKTIIIGAALAVCLAAAILHHTSQPKFESLSAGDFSDLLDSADVQIVDVRTAAEHDAGHIPGTDCNIDVKGESLYSSHACCSLKTGLSPCTAEAVTAARLLLNFL